MTEFVNFFALPDVSRWVIGGLASFVIAALGYAGRNYIKASTEFKKVIHTQLQGIIPDIVVYIEPKEIQRQITDSIIPIKTAGEIFKHSLPFFCVRPFSQALGHYCETARKTDWNEQLAHQVYPDMAKPGYISPKEKLKRAVDDLLKFAK